MNQLKQFINRLFSAVFKLALALAAAVFLLSLMVAALVVVIGVTVWSLLTGRKPAPAKVFGQFRQASHRYTGRTRPAAPGTGRQAEAATDVVDVPAREVPDTSSSKTKPTGQGDSGSEPMTRNLR